jgi:cytochrome o ubiquinol oxidase subunit 3
MVTAVLDNTHLNEQDHEHEHHDVGETKVFGFWIYIMSDCILFATLFATFAVLRLNFAGGPSGKELFELNGVLAETFCLLFSSITYGFAMMAMNAGKKQMVIMWLAITFVLGATFVGLELHEFYGLIADGHSWQQSAFLSSFFALVSTHGLHVSLGLFWMAIMMFQVAKKGLSDTNKTRLMCLSLFWHFLDIVWICVFTFVYLMGVMNG